jgi:metal-responsive CopG/Arc/MetJ family transcriptional regulator
MVRKQIYLEEALIEQIREIAEKDNISQSEVIRESIRDFIRKKLVSGEARNPLLEMIGMVDSDITDGSVNHDKCIYGIEEDDDE